MAKYKVRSNCIAPFAWSRMIGSIPTETPEQKARVEKMKVMETAKIAPLAVYLASDAARGRFRPDLRRARQRDSSSCRRAGRSARCTAPSGWTPQDIAEHGMPALKGSFFPLDRTQDVFTWDPL